jgi:predicted dehydrogenase
MEKHPLRLCIVGLGHIGRVHVEAIEATDAIQLVAGCDTNPALAAILPEGTRFHSRLEGALTAGDVDVVVVATPNQTHNRIARMALEAGRHVIVEKPAATNRGELQALLTSARESGRLLYFALHASTASEVLWTEKHLRKENEHYGALTAFHCRFLDPYIDPLNRQLSHADSLQAPWLDSGVNALSVLLRLQPTLQLEATGLRCSRQLGEWTCILSETAHFRFGNAGYGCIETAWDQQLNQKHTELFFAESGKRLVIDHSRQIVERWDSNGGREVLACFDGDRLVNHYLNLFGEAAASLRNGFDNSQEGLRTHDPYFSALTFQQAP